MQVGFAHKLCRVYNIGCIASHCSKGGTVGASDNVASIEGIVEERGLSSIITVERHVARTACEILHQVVLKQDAIERLIAACTCGIESVTL